MNRNRAWLETMKWRWNLSLCQARGDKEQTQKKEKTKQKLPSCRGVFSEMGHRHVNLWSTGCPRIALNGVQHSWKWQGHILMTPWQKKNKKQDREGERREGKWEEEEKEITVSNLDLESRLLLGGNAQVYNMYRMRAGSKKQPRQLLKMKAGPEKMALSVKCLPHEHEGVHLIPELTQTRHH